MNKLNKTILRICTAITVASSLPIIAQAQDAARLINQANAAVRSGDIDAALADYEQAAAVQPNLPELQYNEAVARYRKGDIEQARQLFHDVVTGGDANLAGRARYNLANCDYADAVKISEQDKPAAIEKLRSAISHYRGALEANSNDADARANIELANMLIKQLQEQQKQEQQQKEQQENKDRQQQDQQNKDQQQQDRENKDQQNKNQQQQDEQNKDSENKDQQSKDENSEQNENEKQDQQQSQDSQKQDQQSDSSKDQNEQNQESQQDQPQDQQDQSQSADQQTQQESQTGNPEEPTDGQPQEQQEDEGKNGQAQAANPTEEQDDQQATNSAQMVNAGDEERPMTKEEAQKMLQAVRDRDLLRRMQRLQDQRSRHTPVDRDW